jgi:hypothetical protein
MGNKFLLSKMIFFFKITKEVTRAATEREETRAKEVDGSQ